MRQGSEGASASAAAIETTSDSSGRPLTFGYTAEGRHLAVVWEHVFDDPMTIYPVTAFDVKERT